MWERKINPSRLNNVLIFARTHGTNQLLLIVRLYRINLYVIVIIINNHNNMYNGTICRLYTHNSHFKTYVYY